MKRALLVSFLLVCSIVLASSMGGFGSGGGGGGSWGSITGTLSDQTDLNTALGLKAPLASPTFTGTVTVPAGSSGTPALQFTGGTALYYSATALGADDGLVFKGASNNFFIVDTVSDVKLNGNLDLAIGTSRTNTYTHVLYSDVGSVPIAYVFSDLVDGNFTHTTSIGVYNTDVYSFKNAFLFDGVGIGYPDGTAEPAMTNAIKFGAAASAEINQTQAQSLILKTNDTARLTIGSTGTSTFSGIISGTNGTSADPGIQVATGAGLTGNLYAGAYDLGLVGAAGTEYLLLNSTNAVFGTNPIPSASGSNNLGSSSYPWGQVWGNTHYGRYYYSGASGYGLVLDTAGAATYGKITVHDGTAAGAINFHADATRMMHVYADPDAAADATAAWDLKLNAANKTAGTGNGGSLTLAGGTSSGGTAGSVLLQTAGSTRMTLSAAGKATFTGVVTAPTIGDGASLTIDTSVGVGTLTFESGANGAYFRANGDYTAYYGPYAFEMYKDLTAANTGNHGLGYNYAAVKTRPFTAAAINSIGMGYTYDEAAPTFTSGAIFTKAGLALSLKTLSTNALTLGTNDTTRLTIASTGEATFTGQVQFPDGAVGTPGITPSSDPDTGFYSGGTNILRAAAGGTQILQISSGGIFVPSGGRYIGFDSGAASLGYSGTDDLDLYGDNVNTATVSGTALTVKKILKSTAGTSITPASYSGNQTLAVTETYARYTGTGGHTFTLPSATGAGTLLIIKHKGSGTLTVSRAGSDTIDGNTSVTLNTGDSLLLIDGATNSWEIN